MSTTSREDQQTYGLRCFEVWGGNSAVTMPMQMPGLDGWIHSKPDGDATGGGDVHYVSSCAHGALTRMLVADVAGHGESVAMIAQQLRKVMRRYVNHHTQTGFVRAMNRAFGRLATDGRFATAVAFSYDAPINKLEVCNAGHPPPLIWRHAAGRWEYLEAPEPSDTNFPLGIESIVEYEQFESSIAVGDIVVAYTDCLPELRLNETELLGPDGLLEIFQSIGQCPLGQLVPAILDRLKSKGSMKDDLTILAFSPNGKRPKVPLHDKLLAPFKMAKIALGG